LLRSPTRKVEEQYFGESRNMSRGGGDYSAGKRQREAESQKRKQEKARRRRERRERGPAEVEIVSAEEVVGNIPSIDEAMRAIEDGRNVNRGASAIPARLFVGGLSYDTTADDLRAAFGKFGNVTDAVVVKDRDTGNSRGFGFVTMENRKDAPRAIAGLNDTELDGRTIFVNVATERGG
jgi:RNA recognition motif-containing protein